MNIDMENVVCIADRDQGDIAALANSIEQVGLLQPIVLRPHDDGRYEVIEQPETDPPSHRSGVTRLKLTPAALEMKDVITVGKE